MTSTTVEAVYRWLFGDEALYVAGMELRVEAGPRVVENPGLRAVQVPHPETGEMVLVIRDDILEHTDDDGRALVGAALYARKSPR